MRTTYRWLGTLAIVVCWAGGAAGADRDRREIALSFYDLAGTGAKTLEKAEAVATSIFAAAGVDTHWRTAQLH